MAAYSYPINPTPTTGSGTVFGKVPGPITLPQPAQDLAQVAPGVAGLGGTIAKTLSDKLGGQISPATQAALQNAAATYGLNIGQPGMSPLAYHNLFGNIAGFAENQANQAIAEYGPFVGAVSQTQTVPAALQAHIAEQNALQAAAPDPTAAQSHAENLYASYLAAMRSPGAPTRQPMMAAATGRAIPSAAAASGFADDTAYPSLATGEWFGGGTSYGPTAATATPVGTPAAQGGQALDLMSMTDEEFANWMTSGNP
jgi:hypothetical protein